MTRFLLLFLIISFYSYSQDVEKIEIPKGVVYKYCKPKLLEAAKEIIKAELSEAAVYKLCDKVMFIGPVLWTRLSQVESVRNIEGGNVTLMVDDKQLAAKMTQKADDNKLVWDAFRKELSGKEYVLRKAKPKELEYYWSVISFDIEEPLIIVETTDHAYILNILPKSMKLLWLDEVPKR